MFMQKKHQHIDNSGAKANVKKKKIHFLGFKVFNAFQY